MAGNGERGCLPNDILNHILKYLPLRDAVRTSILSKEWRFKWLTIPHLVFDLQFELLLAEKYKLVSIINEVLAQHEGPLIKVNFTSKEDIEDDSIIPIWLKLLSNNPIEDFTLTLHPPSVLRAQVPKHLFSFDCLKHLSLTSVAIKLPPAFKGFSCLLTLSLHYIDIDSKDFNMFLSKCPALEVLDMWDNTLFEAINVVIDAPNLKSFTFDGVYQSIFFENVNIEEISILYDDDFGSGSIGGDDVNGSTMIKFFDQLPHVRTLKSDGAFLLFLAGGDVPDELPNYLSDMTTLEVTFVDLALMAHVTCLLCLIRSSPNLQRLEIRFGYRGFYSEMEASDIEYLNALEKCEVSPFHNIKNIKIIDFRGLEDEMAFVKLVLLKSMLLRKLRIIFPVNIGRREVPQLIKALKGFHRASSEAVIEFDSIFDV